MNFSFLVFPNRRWRRDRRHERKDGRTSTRRNGIEGSQSEGSHFGNGKIFSFDIIIFTKIFFRSAICITRKNVRRTTYCSFANWIPSPRRTIWQLFLGGSAKLSGISVTCHFCKFIICFSIFSCEVIRDQKTGNSLQYAFIEFERVRSFLVHILNIT